MILWALFVVDDVREVDDWTIGVLCAGVTVLGLKVFGFAWPFLVGVRDGMIGLRGTMSPFTVGTISSSESIEKKLLV